MADYRNILQQYRNYIFYVCVTTLWIALTAVLSDFLDNPTTGWRGVFIIGGYVVAISIFNGLIIYLFSLSKYTTIILLPLYGLLGSIVSYYRVMYHVTITPLMLDCIFHTNLEEAFGVVTWSLVLWGILNVGIGILLAAWRWQIISPRKICWHALVIVVLLVLYYFGNSRLHQSINHRYPMHIVESMRQYLHIQKQRQNPHTIPKYIVNTSPDSLDIIVVIGESVRADHLSINGYERLTTPLLHEHLNIVSFPYVYTEQTHTLASIPVLLTRADTLHPEYQFTETSFAAILRQQDYHTAWISNQDLGETFSSFPAECDTMIWMNTGKSVFVFSGWYDEELLPAVNQQLSLGYPKNLLILHTIGSHWYYNNHVPESHLQFLPITDNRVVTNNSPQQVINSYDNTILYLDFVLDSVIQRIKNRCAILVYLSDHGESLGENGCWLHAAGAETTKNPACVIWYSDIFAKSYPDKVLALQHNNTKRLRTDFLFHSILSLANISTTDTAQLVTDIFSPIN